MAQVPTSSQDPAFMLHHANVDRQWALFQARGPAFMNHLNDPSPRELIETGGFTWQQFKNSSDLPPEPLGNLHTGAEPQICVKYANPGQRWRDPPPYTNLGPQARRGRRHSLDPGLVRAEGGHPARTRRSDLASGAGAIHAEAVLVDTFELMDEDTRSDFFAPGGGFWSVPRTAPFHIPELAVEWALQFTNASADDVRAGLYAIFENSENSQPVATAEELAQASPAERGFALASGLQFWPLVAALGETAGGTPVAEALVGTLDTFTPATEVGSQVPPEVSFYDNLLGDPSFEGNFGAGTTPSQLVLPPAAGWVGEGFVLTEHLPEVRSGQSAARVGSSAGISQIVRFNASEGNWPTSIRVRGCALPLSLSGCGSSCDGFRLATTAAAVESDGNSSTTTVIHIFDPSAASYHCGEVMISDQAGIRQIEVQAGVEDGLTAAFDDFEATVTAPACWGRLAWCRGIRTRWGPGGAPVSSGEP